MKEQIDSQNQTSEGNKKGLLIKIVIVLVIILAAGLAIVFSKGTGAVGTATLSWKANTESDFAGYKIYYGPSPRNADCPPGGYQEKIDIGNTTTHTFNNLNSGSTYYFSITSYDTSGNESCFSPEVNKSAKTAKFFDRIKNSLRSLWK